MLASIMIEHILGKNPGFEKKLKFHTKRRMVLFRTVINPKSSELENLRDYQKCVKEMNILG